MIDPVLVHAAVVAAYVSVALACWRVAAAADAPAGRLWRFGVAALAALALDKQFGVLDTLTDFAREWVLARGWYDDRQLFQRWLVLGIGLAGAVVFAGSLRRLRPVSPASAVALAGLLFLVCLALARASSQHRVDAFLIGRAALGLRWQAALELLGTAVVALGAGIAMRGRHARGRVPAQRLPIPDE